MNLKFFVTAVVIMVFSFFNCACLLGNQKGYSFKMKNGEDITLSVNKTVVIKNIWKEESLKDWEIKIKVLTIRNGGAQVQVDSPTFLDKYFSENKFVKVGEFISIIQAEEIVTKIELNKTSETNANFSIKILSASPAPELSENFDAFLTP